MAIRIDNLDKPYEISGHAMTAHQHGTARAFGRAGYTVTGTCLGAIVLRGRDDDGSWHWIEVNLDGRVPSCARARRPTPPRPAASRQRKT